MSSVDVRRATEPSAGWRALAAAEGSFYHLPEWPRVLADVFGFPVFYLEASVAGRVVGVLPLAQVRDLALRRRLVSLPFSYATGPVARDEAVRGALVRAARALAADRGIGRVELKSLAASGAVPEGFVRAERYATYWVDLSAGQDAVFAALHSSTRRSIRKAERDGAQLVRATGPDAWATLARLEEETSHRHGVPAPPRRFFVGGGMALEAAGLAALYLATVDGQPAAGIVVWKGPRRWIYAFGASRPQYLERRPNHLLLWTAMQDAMAAGADFDLGRAAPEQTGLVEFKQRWGGVAQPLAYDYWPQVTGVQAAPRDRGPLATAAKLWSRLPPGVARLGSALYRFLG